VVVGVGELQEHAGAVLLVAGLVALTLTVEDCP
jgi:hypothetical protein